MKEGDRVGRYLIYSLLGKGSMGEVYAARDTQLGRLVAIKCTRRTGKPIMVTRLIREARAAALLEHPNVVTVFDVGESDGTPYLVMEFVYGEPLRRFIGDPSVSIPQRLRWLADVARALGAAHRAGLVHRDIKPDNVMVRDDGVVKVLDFGIARRASSSQLPPQAAEIGTITEDGAFIGTPRYVSPEQVRGGQFEARSDQFSWAVMAYELLGGTRLWRAEDTVALLWEIVNGEVAPLVAFSGEERSELPCEVEAVLCRALSKDPSARFPSIDEAADVLDRFAAPARSMGRSDPALTMDRAHSRANGRSARPPQLTGDDESTSLGEAALRGALQPEMGSRQARRRGVQWTPTAMLVAATLVGIVGGAVGYVRRAQEARGAQTTTRARLDGLSCTTAALTGAAASPELARAVGIGACARLAIEVGVAWGIGLPAPALEVSGALEPGEARVTLAVAGHRTSATGPTPLDAITAAVTALGAELAAPPSSPVQIRAWGAKDAEGARRIERVWRRHALRLAANPAAESKLLLETDPDSPWPYVILALEAPRGAPEVAATQEKALRLLAALPPARAHGLKGTFIFRIPPTDRKEGLRLLRQAYGEDPDDVDIAGLYGAVLLEAGTFDEGFAVIDRLWTRFPSRSVQWLVQAVTPALGRDPERDQKYLDRLDALLPESRAWACAVNHRVLEGRFAEARAALDFGVQFGLLGASADTSEAEVPRAMVELAALNPGEARAIATPMLADPRPSVVSGAARIVSASYQIEGRIDDSTSVSLREAERYRGLGNDRLAAVMGLDDLRLRRSLGVAAPPAPRLNALARELERAERGLVLALVRSEIGLARASSAAGARGKAVAREALAAIEAFAEEESQGERSLRDSLLITALPLVRVARGDAEAVRWWKTLDRSMFAVRRWMAMDAALALEATGERAGAEQAYLMAQDPHEIAYNAFTSVAARARLSRLYRAEGRVDEAAQLEATVDRLWAKADPGVRGRVLRLR